MAKPVVILDLDRMLFNTDRFMADVRGVLQAAFGIDPKEFQERYTKFRIVGADDMRHFAFYSQIESYGLEPVEVEREIERRLVAHDYAYADVAPFLGFVTSRASHVMVLTHGERRFQSLKFRAAPVLRGLPFRDVLTHKRQYIASHFAGQHGLLIDDARVGELPAGFCHIWLSRYNLDGAYHGLDEVSRQWPTICQA